MAASVAWPTGDGPRSRPAGIGVRGGGRRARTHSMPMWRQLRRLSATYRRRGRGAESRRRLAPGASTRTTHEHLSPDARCSRHGFSAPERRRLFGARQDASNPLSGLSCDHITAAGFGRSRIRRNLVAWGPSPKLCSRCRVNIGPFLHFAWTKPRSRRCGSPASLAFRRLKYKLRRRTNSADGWNQ